MPSTGPWEMLAFGAFELDPRSGELRKSGLKIKLRGRESQVLLALLENQGRVVTRGELQGRLWPDDTFVEFDNGLNNAISRLRGVLGDSAVSPRYIETLPRHGYRFLMPVARKESGRTGKPMLSRWPIRLALAVLVLAAAGFAFRSLAYRSNRIESVAILPSVSDRSSEASDQDFLDEALAQGVSLRLSKVRGLRLAREKAVAAYEGSQESPAEIARELHVDAIAVESARPENDSVRVTIQLIRGRDGASLWNAAFQEQEANFPRLTQDVARGIAQGARLELTPEEQRDLESDPPMNPQAYEDYQKGLYCMSQLTDSSRHRALGYFEQAIAAAPNFALGYEGLADYYEVSDAVAPKIAMEKAKEYAKKALEKNDALASAHEDLATAYFYGDWNWKESEKEFRRALELNPGLGRAHNMYAIMLSCLGRVQDAVSQNQRAHELDPVAMPPYDVATTIWLNGHQYGQSAQQASRLLELNPSSPVGHEDLGTAYIFEGKYSEALQEFQSAAQNGEDAAFVETLKGFAYARWGKKPQARRELRELTETSRKRYVPAFWFAMLYTGLGANEEAVDSLREAYRERDPYLVFVLVSPFLDELHNEPEFQQLVHEMNFPQ